MKIKRVVWSFLFLTAWVFKLFSSDIEWFTGAGMGWPAAPIDFYFVDSERADRDSLYQPGTTHAHVSLGESYGVRTGGTFTGKFLTFTTSLTVGAIFPHVQIIENPSNPEEGQPSVIWGTDYSERPNFTTASLDALVGLRIPLTKKLFLQPSVGGIVSADAWYALAERVIGENPGEDLTWSAPQKVRFAYGGAAELSLIYTLKRVALEGGYRQFVFAPVDYVHPTGTLSTWFPAFQFYFGVRSLWD